MDVHLITPDTALMQRQFWTAQSHSQDYFWQGRTAERLRQDKGASALELFDAVNGQLM